MIFKYYFFKLLLKIVIKKRLRLSPRILRVNKTSVKGEERKKNRCERTKRNHHQGKAMVAATEAVMMIHS